MNNVSIFIDFDGTISKQDIGDKLFIDFGEIEPAHSMLINGEISIKEYWNRVFNSLKENLDERIITEYAGGFDIDSNFIQFINYCKEADYKLAIVSDGFDSYINPILKKHNLDWMIVRCNQMKFIDGKPVPFFPGASESCKCFCASCKRNAVLSLAPPEDIIIFIGDGYSDYCAAEHADIIFAKKHLAAYCNKHRIPHYPFSTFFDIYRLIREIKIKNKFKVRHQAYLKRKKAFEVE